MRLPRSEDRRRSGRHGDLAERGRPRASCSLPAEEYVNVFPASKHDHFLIPAGTVHCSGADSMVLEISATPVHLHLQAVGLGPRRPRRRAAPDPPRPRPSATSSGTATRPGRRDNLVDQVEALGSGPGWVEERTGLHELEFIEVRRHWFTEAVEHDTAGTVNVLNLVEGAEAVVESPTGAFAPFVVHYAETFIVPAQVGRYRIRPHGDGVGTGWHGQGLRPRYGARARGSEPLRESESITVHVSPAG